MTAHSHLFKIPLNPPFKGGLKGIGHYAVFVVFAVLILLLILILLFLVSKNAVYAAITAFFAKLTFCSYAYSCS